MSTQLERFRNTLSQLFMLDHAELDFGIYRIMNQKRNEINHFLNVILPKETKKLLADNTSLQTIELQKQLDNTIKQIQNLGYDPNTNPKVIELRKKVEQAGSIDTQEEAVYSHLATFFSRYYEEGDFISLRRYKKDIYAIPYEGEEIKLHWANADQYYIKTSQYFRNYSFKLNDGKRVEFTLREANTELNNNLAQNNMERRFALLDKDPVSWDDTTLHINFTYELHPKATKQKALTDKAYDTIKSLIPQQFNEVFTLRPTEKERTRTLLRKHLNEYVAKNSFDYFIHKDLRNFLTRELDFYIKNEILFIDDINTRSTEEFISQLSIIKAVKAVGHNVIQFLSQLEEFQKRLWLKKKFVVQSDYCITLDRVPEELYADICANNRQREEWVQLFAIDEIKNDGTHKEGYSIPLTKKFLQQNPFLQLDTSLFTKEFKQRLIQSIDNLDEQCDGVMINSENFQALQLLQEKYEKQIKCVYIDPPYNSPSSEIPYKNNYKSSSWLSLMNDRLSTSSKLSTDDGSHIVAIDKYEVNGLHRLMMDIFRNYDIVNVAIEQNKKGTQGDHFSYNNEFAIFAVPYSLKQLNETERNKEDWEWSGFRNWGSESLRSDAANCFFPIIVSENKIIGYGNVIDDNIHPQQQEAYNCNHYYDFQGNKQTISNACNPIAIYPIDIQGIERKWRYAFQTMPQIIKYLRIKKSKERIDIEMPKYSDQFKTLWYNSRYNAGDYGTKILTSMNISKELFKFPKSIHTTKDCIYAVSKSDDIILDFFAGSGTTGHAVIDLNRNDKENGKRKYILVEMGTYFDTVTKPRIQKVIYSEDWSNGKPVKRNGSSHCFKYMRLEQYEDTLNNLTIEQNTLENSGEYYNSFLLGYMLNMETRDSLFNMQWFVNPFETKLLITHNNETKEENIDLIETFNYLIGLYVTKITYPTVGVCTVTGKTRKGKQALIIWRDCNKIDNQQLNTLLANPDFNIKNNTLDIIYVNGDNNIDNLRTEESSWRTTLIEQEFNKKMFGADR